MAERRPFPPSARRRALARRAGLHAASPLLVGAAAGAAALVALGAIARATADRLGAAVVAACTGQPALSAGALPAAVASAALPIAGAAAVAAVAAHIAQTGAVWLPRRRIAGAPVAEGGPGPRTRRAAGGLAGAAVIGGVAFAWLWLSAPRLAGLVALGPDGGPGAASALLASLGGALVAAWAALGVSGAVVRRAALARELAMTPAEQREEARLAGADPRWRTHRAAAHRAAHRAPASADAVASASLLVLGDGTAVAIAWDPLHRPIPVRAAAGTGALATQLLGLARRHRIAVHRDPDLAALLVDGEGAVPEAFWPRLAEIIAATRGRDRAR